MIRHTKNELVAEYERTIKWYKEQFLSWVCILL